MADPVFDTLLCVLRGNGYCTAEQRRAVLSLNEAAALYLKESEAFDVTKQYLCKPQRQALQRLCELLFGEGLRKPETSDEYRNGEGKLRVSDATTQTELLRECAQTQTEATLGPTSHSADAGAHPTGASSCGGCPTWAMGSCTSEIDDPVAHKQWLQEQIERERESRNPMLSAYLQWTETPVALGELADALRGRLQGRTGAELMEPFVAYVIENAAGAFLGAQVARRSAPKPLGLRVTDWDRQRDVGFLFHPLPDKGVDLFVVTEALGAAPGLQLHALQVKHGKTELTYTDRTGSAPFAVQSIRERLEAGAQAIQEALEAQGHALEQVFYYVWSTGGFIQRVRCKLQDGSLRIGGQDLRIWEQAELASIVYPELQRLFGEEDWGILDFVRDLHSGTAKGAPT